MERVLTSMLRRTDVIAPQDGRQIIAEPVSTTAITTTAITANAKTNTWIISAIAILDGCRMIVIQRYALLAHTERQISDGVAIIVPRATISRTSWQIAAQDRARGTTYTRGHPPPAP